MRLARVVAALAVAAAALSTGNFTTTAEGELCSGSVTTVVVSGPIETITAVSTVFVTAISTVFVTNADNAPTSALSTSPEHGEEVVTVRSTDLRTEIGTSGFEGFVNAAVSSTTTPAPVSSTSSDEEYLFYVTDGTTSWLNGSPPPTSTHQIFFTSTRTLTVVPVPLSSSQVVADVSLSRVIQHQVILALPAHQLIKKTKTGDGQPSKVSVEIPRVTLTSTRRVIRTLTVTMTGSSAEAESTGTRGDSTTHITMTTTRHRTLFSTIYNWNSTSMVNATTLVTANSSASSAPSGVTPALISLVDGQLTFSSATSRTTIRFIAGVRQFDLDGPLTSTSLASAAATVLVTAPTVLHLPTDLAHDISETDSASVGTLTMPSATGSITGTYSGVAPVDSIFGSSMTTSVPYSKLWRFLSSAHSSSGAAASPTTMMTMLAADNTTFIARSATKEPSGPSMSASVRPTSAGRSIVSAIANCTSSSTSREIESSATFTTPAPSATNSTAVASNGSSSKFKITSSFVLSQEGSQKTSTRSTASRQNATVASSNASTALLAVQTSCGEVGPFTVNWDDEPLWVPANGTNLTDFFPPVTEPYHHLFFSNGYGYVAPPNPNEPYAPYSSPNLCIFDSKLASSNFGTPDSNGVYPGEIGAGWRSSMDEYWFNATSAEMGCNGEACTMVITGFKWDAIHQQQAIFARQNASIPACKSKRNCKLAQVQFESAFKGMTGIQFMAFVNETVRSNFVMDNLQLAWYNNTCAAGGLRFGGKK